MTVPSFLAFYNRLFLVPKPNNKWKPILDLSQLNLYLAPSSFMMESPRDYQTLPSTRGVGHFAGFQRRLLSCSNKSKVEEVPKIPSQQLNFSVHCPSFWPVDGCVGVHKGRRGSQADGSSTEYLNPLVPRRLVTQSPLP